MGTSSMLPQAWSHSNSTSAEYSSPSSAPSYPYPNPKGSELYRLPAPPPRGSRWIPRTLAYTMISASSARQPSLSGRHSEGSWQPCVKVSRCVKTQSAARRRAAEHMPRSYRLLAVCESSFKTDCFTLGVLSGLHVKNANRKVALQRTEHLRWLP